MSNKVFKSNKEKVEHKFTLASLNFGMSVGHLPVSGVTGSGKTVLLNDLIKDLTRKTN